ncbi:MAG: SAM-dependent methyltransferase [Candidatus Thiodiazotropha sp. (ex Myrtea sp. 'scaly one' KF741663)]|nr:SAM-dependent methyltransferase [Candidatus Thiodiazotropha sp. (ex Myrtea sp. 'scaly one' KF741663)]
MPDCLSPTPSPSVKNLPPPDDMAQAVSDRLLKQVKRAIDQSETGIPFDRFMEMALYAPGLGYYVAGSRKFGEDGDFITSPEVSPLFAQCLARQAQQVLDGLGQGDILEFGAGSGILAADMLAELERLDSLPGCYAILEISPELQARQRETIEQRVPHLLTRVEWLQTLPTAFSGFVIANELLDAMPVNRFRLGEDGIEESFVVYDDAGLKERFGEPETPGLREAVESAIGSQEEMSEGYISEINLRQASWLRALADSIRSGVVILIDYGYCAREYFHTQRNRGTLMCHYRHRAHTDPFRWVGLQDITSHVDFTAAARVGLEAGFHLGGYTTQAHFLLANGLDTLLADSDPGDVAKHMALVQGVKRLTLPSEMGERFKVLGLIKGIEMNLQGFGLRDFCERL